MVYESKTHVMALVPRMLLACGEWVSAADDCRFGVENPATATELGQIANGGMADSVLAVKSAVKTQARWSRPPSRIRSEILRRAYEIILDRADDLALLMTLEMGKPLSEARVEVTAAADFFRGFAEECVYADSGTFTRPDPHFYLMRTPQPVGPCVVVTLWNFPLAPGAGKIGAAVAAGCTAILVPSSKAPLSSLALAEILHDAGLPAGVLNVAPTNRAQEVIEGALQSGHIRRLSLGGSATAGRGPSPFIVFDDADLTSAVDSAVAAKTHNTGQSHMAANHFYVQRCVIEEFTERLAASLSDLSVGSGTRQNVRVGPLIDAASKTRVASLLDDAVAKGAKAVYGGYSPEGRGHFYMPTVLAQVSTECDVVRTEIFGPVAPVMSFDTETEAVRLANHNGRSPVGYVFTRDTVRAMNVSERLDAARIGLNTELTPDPASVFSGFRKLGLRDDNDLGIEEFLGYKYVAAPLRMKQS